MKVNVIGAGLAGCEAVYQVAKRGIDVDLYEMKPLVKSEAHKSNDFAELICSNSLKSDDVCTAGGLLKGELRLFDSLLISCAEQCRVPAGSALAVDRTLFSNLVTSKLKSMPNVKIINKVVDNLNFPDDITIVATGPLTNSDLIPAFREICGDFLYFFDAVAPIVTTESIDFDSAFYGSRYNKGEDDYVNCPMNKQEFEHFWFELTNAKTADIHDFDNNVFEGCMPIEVMANRGMDTIRFGPLKPVGLFDERKNEKPYAVLQLRKENVEGTIYNLVGFQTHLTFGEQKRVFSLIPALKDAEFVRYGVMHRNTYINSPKILNNRFQVRNRPNLFFAGQLTGVEGYVESIASGLIAGINASNIILNKPLTDLTNETMIGSLANHVSINNVDYQPMNANFGILKPLPQNYRDKNLKKQAYSDRAISQTKNIISQIQGE